MVAKAYVDGCSILSPAGEHIENERNSVEQPSPHEMQIMAYEPDPMVGEILGICEAWNGPVFRKVPGCPHYGT